MQDLTRWIPLLPRSAIDEDSSSGYKKIRDWLHFSSHVHVRKRGVSNLRELVDLFDRFHDNKLRYSLEWDDFISWPHENSYVEQVRDRLGGKEFLLFSKSMADRKMYAEFVLEERNRVAALIGIETRGR